MKSGIYQLSEQAYHSDPCPQPALSASIAGIIWHRSPLHGWYAHPKLNPDYQPFESATFDLGSAAHAIVLEQDRSKLVIIHADDWRTKAAREERDEAHDAGKIPVLARQAEDIYAMADAAIDAVKDSELDGIFQDGKPEQSIIVQDGDIWLRGRLDWLTNDNKIILDYKTVGRSANPESFLRGSVFQYGYDIQVAMYQRLVQAVTGETPKFVWLAQETEAPYACSLMGASPSLIESGNRKLDHVNKQWRECMKTGIWPAYGKRIAWLEAPSYELAKLEEREYMEDVK